MLVLRAKDNQVIIIRNQNTGQEMELFAVRDGNKIKLCFDAPKCFRIVRQELVQKADQEAGRIGANQPTEKPRAGQALRQAEFQSTPS